MRLDEAHASAPVGSDPPAGDLSARDGSSSTAMTDEAQVFRELYPALRRFAAIWAPRGVEPDDLLQQAVANTLARGPLNEIRDLAAYLRTSIANLARGLYGSTDVQLTSSPPDAAAPDDVYPSDLRLIFELPPAGRAALFLVDIEGLSYRDAARILGCSAPALRARTSRARRELRTLLESEASEL